MKILLFMFTSLLVSSIAADVVSKSDMVGLPKLKMPGNGLTFKMIEGYQDYKIVATHFRTDKKELRYVLANQIGYDALKERCKIMPEGSKIVKIGWSVKQMPLFPTALEADKLQRVEYMVKDPKQFDADGDHWGYARFVKKGDRFVSWDKGTDGCISCHSIAKDDDHLFTSMQSTFK